MREAKVHESKQAPSLPILTGAALSWRVRNRPVPKVRPHISNARSAFDEATGRCASSAILDLSGHDDLLGEEPSTGKRERDCLATYVTELEARVAHGALVPGWFHCFCSKSRACQALHAGGSIAMRRECQGGTSTVEHFVSIDIPRCSQQQ